MGIAGVFSVILKVGGLVQSIPPVPGNLMIGIFTTRR